MHIFQIVRVFEPPLCSGWLSLDTHRWNNSWILFAMYLWSRSRRRKSTDFTPSLLEVANFRIAVRLSFYGAAKLLCKNWNLELSINYANFCGGSVKERRRKSNGNLCILQNLLCLCHHFSLKYHEEKKRIICFFFLKEKILRYFLLDKPAKFTNL